MSHLCGITFLPTQTELADEYAALWKGCSKAWLSCRVMSWWLHTKFWVKYARNRQKSHLWAELTFYWIAQHSHSVYDYCQDTTCFCLWHGSSAYRHFKGAAWNRAWWFTADPSYDTSRLGLFYDYFLWHQGQCLDKRCFFWKEKSLFYLFLAVLGLCRCMGFCIVVVHGGHSSCRVWAGHCSGFSCREAWALGM